MGVVCFVLHKSTLDAHQQLRAKGDGKLGGTADVIVVRVGDKPHQRQKRAAPLACIAVGGLGGRLRDSETRTPHVRHAPSPKPSDAPACLGPRRDSQLHCQQPPDGKKRRQDMQATCGHQALGHLRVVRVCLPCVWRIGYDVAAQ